MTSQAFVYWLQGFFEISGETEMTKEQCEIVKDHLNMVFVHEIDPSIPDPKGKLQEAHDGKKMDPPFRPPYGWPPGDKKMRC